ncbi:MAG TPA: DUF1552 domain-containing protein [Bdellovibrionales bacterium]|nr:DUF1552 domain-containing protein [Bdellovibrionales bacterium]
MNGNNRPTRRQFLKGAGGASLALPFLPSLLTRAAWGQTVTFPKRLLAMQTPNGTVYKNWYPSVEASRVIAPNVRDLDLTSLPGPISTILGPEVSAFKNKLLLLRGLDGRQGDGHNNSEILAGSRPDPALGDRSSHHISIDNILAQSKKVYATEPKTRTLGIAGWEDENSISYIKSGDKVVSAPVYHDMSVAFDSLFSGLSVSPDEAAKLKARNLTLVDRVFNDYKRVMASASLGRTDRLRLDAHVTHIFELQKRIEETKVAAGCVPPASGMGYSRSMQLAFVDAYANNMIDLIVAALRCDLTRLISFVPYGGGFVWPFIPTMYANIHVLAHNDNAVSDVPLTDVQVFIAKKFARLLSKLDEVVEDTSDGSTLLDHTAVIWRQEFSGNGVYNHKKIDIPVLVAGGGKFLRTGRYVDYRVVGQKRRSYDHTWMGVPYNQLLVTMLNGFGLTPAEFEQGGEAGIGDYGDPASLDYADYKINDTTRRAPLFSLLK